MELLKRLLVSMDLSNTVEGTSHYYDVMNIGSPREAKKDPLLGILFSTV